MTSRGLFRGRTAQTTVVKDSEKEMNLSESAVFFIPCSEGPLCLILTAGPSPPFLQSPSFSTAPCSLAPAFRLHAIEFADIFVYFSHHLVSLPPPSWISLCHRRGVRCLGTFLTEWEEGKEVCRRLFHSPIVAIALAERLVALAGYHGLDGWLINIENEVESETAVENMVIFLRALTRGMKKVKQIGATVLWYDSVVSDTGKLEWQDGLTERNKVFFHACDGIFTNYCWKREGPAASAVLAKTSASPWSLELGISGYEGVSTMGRAQSEGLRGRPRLGRSGKLSDAAFPDGEEENKEGPEKEDSARSSKVTRREQQAHKMVDQSSFTASVSEQSDLSQKIGGGKSRQWDVWMGVDCFGRGTYGGGGFNCSEALEAARAAGVSAALFAPGWIWEEEVRRRETERGQGAPEEKVIDSLSSPILKAHSPQSHASSHLSSAVAKFYRIEGIFEAVQEEFWSKVARIWPRRPLPAGSLGGRKEEGGEGGQKTGERTFLTNFGTGVGLKVWVAAGQISLCPAITAVATICAEGEEGGEERKRREEVPWYNLNMQDPLPLVLTDCTVRSASFPNPPSPPTADRQRSAAVRDGSLVLPPPLPLVSPPCHLRAQICYQTAFHGGSSLHIRGILSSGAREEGGEKGISFPLFKTEVPTSASPFEVNVVYHCEHEDDEFVLELVLHKDGADVEGEKGMGKMPEADKGRQDRRLVLRRQGPGDWKGGQMEGGDCLSRETKDEEAAKKGAQEGSQAWKRYCEAITDYPVADGRDGRGLKDVDESLRERGDGRTQRPPSSSTRASLSPSGDPSLNPPSFHREESCPPCKILPWRRRHFRVLDMPVAGDTTRELRLRCLKQPLPSSVPASLVPRPYGLYLGEISMGYAPASDTEEGEGQEPSLRLSPSLLRLRRPLFMGGRTEAEEGGLVELGSLLLKGAGWEGKQRILSGQLVWKWRRPREVHSTEVILFFLPPPLPPPPPPSPSSPSPLWLGRALTSVFPLCMRIPAWEGEREGGSVRIMLQPGDGFGNRLPLCECPSLQVAIP